MASNPNAISYLDGKVVLHPGDCLDVLRGLPDASIDSCVTDPPYALVSIVKRSSGKNAAPAKENGYGVSARGFMGKEWDTGERAFAVEFWAEVLRVLKPGGHVLAFGGTRTYHRLACAVEDVGFEIRDQIGWLYGSGFPKSHDVSKGIDKAAGAEREIIAKGRAVKRMIPGADQNKAGWEKTNGRVYEPTETAPATDTAREWQGWGTALKPAWEPLVVARKPLSTPAIYVRANVERALRESGIDEEIKWTNGAANDAKSFKPQINSSSTRPHLTAGTSAGHAAGNEMPSGAKPIASSSGPLGKNGTSQTLKSNEKCRVEQIENCASKCSMDTEASAPVAEKQSEHFSPLTTSTVAGPNTGKQFTGKSTGNSAERGSPQDTEFFAGIATGLSGSMDAVRISRNPDGSFVWPHDLPEYVEGKPLTVAANVLAHGTGALNIDACRVEASADLVEDDGKRVTTSAHEGYCRPNASMFNTGKAAVRGGPSNVAGRWPANVIHDGSEEVLQAFPDAPGQQRAVTGDEPSSSTRNTFALYNERATAVPRNDSGSAARFFYTAKADADDRVGSKHPTVKPINLMRYLVRLVTPPGGVVLDPFAGTGTTGQAAFLEGFRAVLVEREAEYQADIARRMELVLAGPDERAHAIVKAKGTAEEAGPLFAGATS